MTAMEWSFYRVAVGQQAVKLLLCDDDPEFLKEMRAELERVFTKLHLRAAFAVFNRPGEITPEDFAACDMIFLDIDFDNEDCNGIDIARRLRQENKRALLFFVTNFIDYAPAGYEVDAFRYILKRDITVMLERYVIQAMEQFAEGQEYLRLQDKDGITDIPVGDISYLEVLNHSVSIHAGGQTYELNATLSSLEERLENRGFLRVHKSYLANMGHIRRFRSRECLLDDGTVLAVSERNYAQQKQKYLLWKGLK